MGIEPTLEAWEAAVLPLNYTRTGTTKSAIIRHSLPVPESAHDKQLPL